MTFPQVFAGSADELEHQQGMAHLVEHVAYMGSRKRLETVTVLLCLLYFYGLDFYFYGLDFYFVIFCIYIDN